MESLSKKELTVYSTKMLNWVEHSCKTFGACTAYETQSDCPKIKECKS